MANRLIIADIRSMESSGEAKGHYFTVAQNYLDMFKDKCDVKIAGGPIYKKRFNEKDLLLLKYNAQSTCTILENKRRELSNLKQLLDSCKEDTIVFQSSAVSTAYVGIALWAKKQSLFMIQYNTMSLNSAMKRSIYAFAKNKIKGVICPNDVIGKAYDIPYLVVTDYIYTGSVKETSVLPLEYKKYDFGFFGIITEDKGVLEMAQYFAMTNYRVIIAGHPNSEKLAKNIADVCRKNTNIETRFKYLNEEEYIRGIQECKYCVLNYSGAYSEHSSGVIYDVLFNGTPVIGTKCKALKIVDEFKIGYLYNNIYEIDCQKLMDKNLYNEYRCNLLLFKKSQKEQIHHITDFLLTGKNNVYKENI